MEHNKKEQDEKMITEEDQFVDHDEILIEDFLQIKDKETQQILLSRRG